MLIEGNQSTCSEGRVFKEIKQLTYRCWIRTGERLSGLFLREAGRLPGDKGYEKSDEQH